MSGVNKHNHKVSVIVPIYNVEPYLDRCVKSIVNQTHKNLEIILVNDGSPDRCPQICDEWQKRDDRIKVIHKTNGGIASARNTGLDNAAGDFISFIDSDDFITDNFIETLYNLCAEYNCDIAQCNFIKVYNDDIIPCAQEDNIRVFSNIEMLHNIYNELYVPTIVPANKLYKKHLFESIRYPTGNTHDDEATIHKVIHRAGKIAVSEKKMYMYYQNSGGAILSKYNRKRLGYIEALEDRIQYFSDNGLNELRDKTMERYCSSIIVAYINSGDHIPDCQDILNELMDKYKCAYKKVLFQKNTSLYVKMKVTAYRLMPRLLAWTGKIK